MRLVCQAHAVKERAYVQGTIAERARVGELILSHYLPADLDAISEAEWAERAGRGFTGTTTAGRDGLRRTIQRMAPPAP